MESKITCQELTQLFLVTFQGQSTELVQLATQKLNTIPPKQLFSTQFQQLLTSPDIHPSIKTSATNYLSVRVRDILETLSELELRSGANWMLKMFDHKSVNVDKSKLVSTYIWLTFADDRKRHHISPQTLLKVKSKIQFYFSKRNSKLANILYEQLLQYPWKTHQKIDINSYVLPLMLDNIGYHLNKLKQDQNIQENFKFFLQTLRLFKELIISIELQQYSPTIPRLFEQNKLQFILNCILTDPFFQNYIECYEIAYTIMIYSYDALIKMKQLHLYPIVEFIENVSIKDWNNALNHQLQVDLLACVIKGKENQHFLLCKDAEQILQRFLVPIWNSFRAQYESSMIMIENKNETIEIAQKMHDVLEDACYSRSYQGMFTSFLKLMLTTCEKDSEFQRIILSQLYKALNNERSQLQSECGLLLLIVMVQRIMKQEKMEAKIADFLKNSQKIIHQGRSLTFLIIQLYYTYIDEIFFQYNSMGDLPSILLHCIEQQFGESALRYAATEALLLYYRQNYPYDQQRERVTKILENIEVSTLPLASIVIKKYYKQISKEDIDKFIGKIFNKNVINQLNENTLYEILKLGEEILSFGLAEEIYIVMIGFIDSLFFKNLPFLKNLHSEIVKIYKIALESGIPIKERIQWLVNEAIKSQTFPDSDHWCYEEFLFSFYRFAGHQFLFLLKEKIFRYLETKKIHVPTESRILIMFHWLLSNHPKLFNGADSERIIDLCVLKKKKISELPDNCHHFLKGKYQMLIIYLISKNIPIPHLEAKEIQKMFSPSQYCVIYDVEMLVYELCGLMLRIINKENSLHREFHRQFCHQYVILTLKLLQKLLLRTKRMLEEPQMQLEKDIAEIYHADLIGIYKEMIGTKTIDPFSCFRQLYRQIKQNSQAQDWFEGLLRDIFKEISKHKMAYLLSTQRVVKEGEDLYQRILKVRVARK